jgi:hypothetical protein
VWAEGFRSLNVNKNLSSHGSLNVVLGSWGFEDFEKKKEASGFKRERLERFDPLETFNFFLMKKAMSYLVSSSC